MTEGEQRRDHAANAVTCWPTATMARARHELEWLQLEGVAAQVSKEAGGERVEEGGRKEEGGRRTEKGEKGEGGAMDREGEREEKWRMENGGEGAVE